MASTDSTKRSREAEEAAQARAEQLAERMPRERSPRRKMLLVANPYASTVSDRLKALVTYALQSRYEVMTIETEARDHAIELSRRAAEDGLDLVAALGGDGTINEVAHGLAGTQTALAVLPGGSTNVFCRSVGIPNDVVDATEHLLGLADRFVPRRIDLGRVNGRHFVSSSGIGLDAEVVRHVDSRPGRKLRYRGWYFAWAAVRAFAGAAVDGKRLRVECDGQLEEGLALVVQNSDPYTFLGLRPICVCEQAGLGTGSLSGVILREASFVDYSTLGPRLLMGRASAVSGHRHISSLRRWDRALVVCSDGQAAPLHVDGDYLGEVEEATYETVAGGLSILA
jgi:diacylglycerol kinase family enzyme